MACSNPTLLTRYMIPKYLRSSPYWLSNDRLSIPCRTCLNCRVDNRNQWSDRCKWEYKKRLTASFVTLTYDDIHIVDKLIRSPVDNKLNANLDYYDMRKFIWRLRDYIKNHKELHGVLCQPDFSYLYVGEYGENGNVFDRPHFHVLFFGLDFAFMRNILNKCWKQGFIDVLPLLDGGINYVLKYMDKQVFGELAELKYDNHLLNRPKRCTSMSFGADLYTDKAQEILDNGMTYQSGHVRRPVPAYFKHKFYDDFTDTVSQIKIIKNTMKNTYNLSDTSGKALSAFKLRQSRLRERKLRQKILNDGVGVLDYLQDNSMYYAPNRERLKSLSISWQSYLASEYRDTLIIGG